MPDTTTPAPAVPAPKEQAKQKEPSPQKEQPAVYISSSPHFGSPVNTRKLMTRVLIALAPASIFGVVLYGLPALVTIAVSVAAAELSEALFRKIIRREMRNRDLSAAVTGLLLALVLPPGTPWWITALGAIFAIVVVKEFFGGLGANVFNPALAGRAFLLMSFPVALTTWPAPRPFFPVSGAVVDAMTTATPLGMIKLGSTLTDVSAGLAAGGLAGSSSYVSTLGSLFLGIQGGCTGETSAVLILIGFIYLLATGTIDWRAPVAMIVSAAVFTFIFGGDPLVAVLSGGLFFGAVFMVTDYTTAPITAAGKLIFGAGTGLIVVLIRNWGNYPEGVAYSILIMNAVTPFLNRLLQKKYGYVPARKDSGAKPAAEPAAKGRTK